MTSRPTALPAPPPMRAAFDVGSKVSKQWIKHGYEYNRLCFNICIKHEHI